MLEPSALTEVASFSVKRLRFLAPDGVEVAPLPEAARSSDTLIRFYRAMVLTRVFDEKAVALQRTGRLGTYASSLGQEAVGVGVASAMAADDVLLPSFREQAAMLWRGVSMVELLLYWGGDERGSDFKVARHDFPVCIPVASQFPHAVGVALAMQMRRRPHVALAVGGDGATSKGDFSEALNMAGVWRAPVVFVVNNNQWAISVPRAAQSAAQTLAQKAIAAGVACVQVDGNDVIAVHAAVADAIERARLGEGPSLVEALTYRLSDHTTADDARRYRSDAEVSAHWKEEPVARLRAHLVARGVWDKSQEAALAAECRKAVDDAVEAYLGRGAQAPRSMLDHVFATLPRALESLAQALSAAEGAHG
jgi:pyruvate dehydrogenase E1 component alpha subunit